MSPVDRSRRRFRRLTLLLLVIIPFIPTIVILAIAAIAKIKGCQLDQKDVCLIGSLPVSDIIVWMLRSSASVIAPRIEKPGSGFEQWLFVAVGGWLVACYAILMLGWARVSSRLLLGFALTLVLAFLPYVGLNLALWPLRHNGCYPNIGYIGQCLLFGGEVGRPAHDAVKITDLVWRGGARLAFAIFAVHVVIVVVLGVIAARRRDARA